MQNGIRKRVEINEQGILRSVMVTLQTGMFFQIIGHKITSIQKFTKSLQLIGHTENRDWGWSQNNSQAHSIYQTSDSLLFHFLD